MDAGELVPDDVILGIVRDYLRVRRRAASSSTGSRARCRRRRAGRTAGGAGPPAGRVLVLDVDDETLVKRLSGRRSCAQCGAVYNVHFEPPGRTGAATRAAVSSCSAPTTSPRRSGAAWRCTRSRPSRSSRTTRVDVPVCAWTATGPSRPCRRTSRALWPRDRSRHPDEIDAIAAGRRGSWAGCSRRDREHACRGVTTADLDRFAEEFIRSHEGRRAGVQGTLRLSGQPVHVDQRGGGARHPVAKRRLARGRHRVLDAGVKLDGWFADAAVTFPVGEIDEPTQRLLEVTRARSRRHRPGPAGQPPGRHRPRRPAGGRGRRLRRGPRPRRSWHRPRAARGAAGAQLRPARPRAPAPGRDWCSPSSPWSTPGDIGVRTLADRWTVCHGDGSRSAHFEHTVAVTENGPAYPDGS
jgi:methionyl aminopeptidase